MPSQTAPVSRASTPIAKIAIPERIYFTEVLPTAPRGKIMRRFLEELTISVDLRSDVTALEEASSIDRLKAIIAGG